MKVGVLVINLTAPVFEEARDGICMDGSTDARTRGHMLGVNSLMRDTISSLPR